MKIKREEQHICGAQTGIIRFREAETGECAAVVFDGRGDIPDII